MALGGSSNFVPHLGQRDLFPTLEAVAYLAHAAISPLNIAGQRHVERCLADLARGGALAFLPWAEQRVRLRTRLAELFSVPADDLALTAGTSHGIVDLALALPLKEGDEVVTFRGEFPANVLPFRSAAERVGARLYLLPEPNPLDLHAPEKIVNGLKQRLEMGARYITVSAVQFQTGMAMPLGAISELAKRYEAHLHVDAIQAAGSMPLSVRELGIDALTVGAHKWLLGVEGAGALYLDRAFYQKLQPLTLGWQSLVHGEAFLFEGKGKLDYGLPAKDSALAFEGSTPVVTGHAAFEAGVEICLMLQPARIFEHIQAYHDALEGELTSLGLVSLRSPRRDSRSGLLCFDLPSGVAIRGIVAALRSRGIVASSPDGYLRFAPHFANSVSEVPAVVRAVEEALAQVGGGK
jgi:cysteine desulfurase / selenocysteine lyase